MAVIQELIRTEDNGTISFGDYELAQKSKLSDYQFRGDLYKVKTFREITRLERNGMFVYESVPGTTVLELMQDERRMEFFVEGFEDAQVTVELEAEADYLVLVDDVSLGSMRASFGGKLSFSLELSKKERVQVRIEKC